MALQDITLKDKTAKIKVAVWDNMVGTITTGQLLSLTRCRVRLFNDEKKSFQQHYHQLLRYALSNELSRSMILCNLHDFILFLLCLDQFTIHTFVFYFKNK